jgi:hypothetical protein
MGIDWRAACVAVALTAAVAGCGSYSAPNNPPSAPDSGGDTTAMSPPGYSQR